MAILAANIMEVKKVESIPKQKYSFKNFIKILN
jgi:hypothetical protein